MPEPGEPTIGNDVDPSYSYPRDVWPDPGIPKGWRQVENAFGPSAKMAGKIYIRYHSPCGKHNGKSAGQAIKLHCDETGEDADAMTAEYKRLQQDPPEGSRLWLSNKNKEGEREKARKERESKGKLEGEAREKAIAAFHQHFGALTGPTVYAFPGWRTRWQYRERSSQTFVTYIDPDGREWQFLKELEVYLQLQFQKGEPGPGGADIEQMVKVGRANANPELFAVGARTARETGGAYEVAPDGNALMMSQEEANAEREKKSREREKERGEKPRLPKKLRPQGDYELDQLSVIEVEIQPHDAVESKLKSEDVPHCERVASVAGKCSDLLTQQKIKLERLIIVFGCSAVEHRYIERVSGVYYQRPESFNERPYYQQMRQAPNGTVCCSDLFLFWNKVHTRWQISVFSARSSGYAVNYADHPVPTFKGWAVLRVDSISPAPVNPVESSVVDDSRDGSSD